MGERLWEEMPKLCWDQVGPGGFPPHSQVRGCCWGSSTLGSRGHVGRQSGVERVAWTTCPVPHSHPCPASPVDRLASWSHWPVTVLLTCPRPAPRPAMMPPSGGPWSHPLLSLPDPRTGSVLVAAWAGAPAGRTPACCQRPGEGKQPSVCSLWGQKQGLRSLKI